MTKKKIAAIYQDACPKCGDPTRTMWTKGRKLQRGCCSCGWEGKPFTPPKKPVRTTKTVHLEDGCGGWTYELFDRYGHDATSSETYNSRASCEKAARRDIENTSKEPSYGKCVAVIWPPTAKVRGILIR